MIDLQVIRTRAAARMAASQTLTPANVAKRLTEAPAISHLAGLAGGIARAANTVAPDRDGVGWTDADIARFLDRRARLMRWGWPEAEAEQLADRLVQRDREHDARVSCTDCTHYRPGRCVNYQRAGLHAPDVGRDLASRLQRCPGFQPSAL